MSARRPIHLLRLLAVLAVAVVTPLVGCSSDDDADATTTTTEAADDTTSDDADDAVTDTTLVDSELCALAAESDPDLSGLPALLPEELREDAAEFVQRYDEWKASGGDPMNPPRPSEEIVTYITDECFPDSEPMPADEPTTDGDEPTQPES